MTRISISSPVFNGNEKKYLDECIDTGWLSANGRFVTEFEERFAEFCGTKHALACSNGTVSLHLCLLALGIEPGDEVILPSLTYVATANSVVYCGGRPVFVDCMEDTFNIDVSRIESAITPRTRAILPVHLYGLVCDMGAIDAIAKGHGLAVVEDAAEAFGAKYGDRKAGSFGDMASFSFFGNKIITCGEGGMLVTDDESIYRKAKLLKGQGMSSTKRYWHDVVGYNYRMTNMQAAVGLGQLENGAWHLGQRRRVADLYRKHLAGFQEHIRMQAEPPGYTHAYWMSNVILQDRVAKERDAVMEELEACGIETRPVFYPAHVMPPHFVAGLSLPVTERLSARGISLPSHALLTEEDVVTICDRLCRSIGCR